MKKISVVCSVALALIMALSCLALPVSAVGVTVVQKPNQTSFYQGIDWMYDKNGKVMLMNGDPNLASFIIFRYFCFRNKQVKLFHYEI